MSRTAQLALPLLLPAQAQKHVTVNEALARLDATAQLRVISSHEPNPPASATDGASYLVPPGATGDWQNKGGQIAIWCNGGWIFVVPKAGWRAWDESLGGFQMFDGTGWAPNAVALSPSGAAVSWRVLEFDHAITSGASNLSSVSIPAPAQVFGVTGRVVSALVGSGLTGWRIGVPGSDNRYGSGLGTAANSYLLGLSGSPVAYYAPTPLLISAEGGSFTSGIVRLAVHMVELAPPRPV
jgi:Protein of unknown function (DUF2793)